MSRTRVLALATVIAVASFFTTGVVTAQAAGSGVATVAAVAKPSPVCLPISADGVGQDLGGGRTTATISVAGVVIGTTEASFTVTGIEGSVASFTGDITFRNPYGTLVAPVSGTLDTATGHFVSFSTTVSGTRAYRQVTGSLTFTGTENLATGAFTEVVTGTLCVPRPRP
jgi:hypothetical protein